MLRFLKLFDRKKVLGTIYELNNSANRNWYCSMCGRKSFEPYRVIAYGKPTMFLCLPCKYDYHKYLELKEKFGGLE